VGWLTRTTDTFVGWLPRTINTFVGWITYHSHESDPLLHAPPQVGHDSPGGRAKDTTTTDKFYNFPHDFPPACDNKPLVEADMGTDEMIDFYLSSNIRLSLGYKFCVPSEFLSGWLLGPLYMHVQSCEGDIVPD
jgi:hypothetical protein